MALKLQQVNWHQAGDRCLRIRHEVFVREQGIPLAIEVDGRDPECSHVLASRDAQDVGTARLLSDAHIGRVAVLPAHRGHGVGARMMEALCRIAAAQGHACVHLSSQSSAIDFYLKLGFEIEGDEFIEAGIPHRNMCRPL